MVDLRKTRTITLLATALMGSTIPFGYAMDGFQQEEEPKIRAQKLAPLPFKDIKVEPTDQGLSVIVSVKDDENSDFRLLKSSDDAMEKINTLMTTYKTLPEDNASAIPVMKTKNHTKRSSGFIGFMEQEDAMATNTPSFHYLTAEVTNKYLQTMLQTCTNAYIKEEEARQQKALESEHARLKQEEAEQARLQVQREEEERVIAEEQARLQVQREEEERQAVAAQAEQQRLEREQALEVRKQRAIKVQLNSTGLPKEVIHGEDGSITVTTDNNNNASYQLRSAQFPVKAGQNISIFYDVNVNPGGIMSFGLLNQAGNNWYGPEVILREGHYNYYFERTVPAEEFLAALIVRNYHLGEPAQTTFTLNHLTMDIEPKDVREANLPPLGLVLPVAEPGAAPVAIPQQPENEIVVLQQELLKIEHQAAAGEAELKQELLRIQHAQEVEDLKAKIQAQKIAAEQADLERQRQIAAAQAVLAQQQQAAAEHAAALEQARQAAEAAKQQAEDAARQQAAAQHQARQRLLEETAQNVWAAANQQLQTWHNSLSNHTRRGNEKSFNKKNYNLDVKDHDLAKAAWNDPNNALINRAVNDPVLYAKLWSKADRFPALSGNGSLIERLQAAKLAQIKATLS
jgi:hypothetical protein